MTNIGTGRTGRIGNRGIATSLFSERDEGIASVLTRTLLETNQEIPDFLQQYIPEGEALERLKFEVESDFDENDVAGAGDASGGGGWGSSEDNGASGGGWGSAENGAPATNDGGWGSADAADASNDNWGAGTASAPSGW